MFVLHAGLEVKAGQEQTLAKDYAGPFSAAISAQEGFRHVALLRPDGGGDYVLTIAFDTHALQQKWVATDLHQQVWSLMEAHLVGFTVKTYNTV
jgi:heme-degrading monooxygenase HmoA